MTPSEATTNALTRCIIELWRVLAEREETVHRLQASNTELLERARKAEAAALRTSAAAEKFEKLFNLAIISGGKEQQERRALETT